MFYHMSLLIQDLYYIQRQRYFNLIAIYQLFKLPAIRLQRRILAVGGTSYMQHVDGVGGLTLPCFFDSP